ncbi:hypothetical protein H310_10853 [Aphanomyces invadans]|uniref:Uncharacterized protein n=1 Tax=Aphanomyces invadans TaxID=157072 RepID=A0A024TP48_9STRA|nr:hypothetical protein H310_10853 [Aphanomyces invadans]ETV95798.1 hypothetical protein H310_10853 [Aphanomyces invadans]|eukprot:XP_008875550.1 hypothetical protein H310_10853 [Aphanomyces invadans]
MTCRPIVDLPLVHSPQLLSYSSDVPTERLVDRAKVEAAAGPVVRDGQAFLCRGRRHVGRTLQRRCRVHECRATSGHPPAGLSSAASAVLLPNVCKCVGVLGAHRPRSQHRVVRRVDGGHCHLNEQPVRALDRRWLYLPRVGSVHDTGHASSEPAPHRRTVLEDPSHSVHASETSSLGRPPRAPIDRKRRGHSYIGLCVSATGLVGVAVLIDGIVF